MIRNTCPLLVVNIFAADCYIGSDLLFHFDIDTCWICVNLFILLHLSTWKKIAYCKIWSLIDFFFKRKTCHSVNDNILFIQRSAPIGNNDDNYSGRKSATPTPRGDNTSPSKPEAVVHAMKVCLT